VRRIRLIDRKTFENFFRFVKWNSFYHYFPLIYVLDKTVERIYWEKDRLITRGTLGYLNIESPTLTVYVGNDGRELLFPSFELSTEKVWIALEKNPLMKNDIYDVNFVYDLGKEFPKSFRENAVRFHRDSQPIWREASPKEALEVVENWYAGRREGEYGDFGYTIYLAKNFHRFELNANVVEMKGEPKAVSIWGKLDEESAVHLVAKDLGCPYLHDYLRRKTYADMIEKGFKFANDGGAPTEGIRIYKTKLRPFLIFPLYSWVRE